jgi:hypothetical protein
MTDAPAYTKPDGVVTRQVRHINGEVLKQPLTVTYHVSNEAETLDVLRRAGMEFVDDGLRNVGAFF